jgi:sensor domain CHASE-containing protein
MLQAQIGNNDDEANKAFSAAVQMHDTLVKAWALWGDYLETIFTNNSTNIRYLAGGGWSHEHEFQHISGFLHFEIGPIFVCLAAICPLSAVKKQMNSS